MTFGGFHWSSFKPLRSSWVFFSGFVQSKTYCCTFLVKSFLLSVSIPQFIIVYQCPKMWVNNLLNHFYFVLKIFRPIFWIYFDHINRQVFKSSCLALKFSSTSMWFNPNLKQKRTQLTSTTCTCIHMNTHHTLDKCFVTML